MGPFRGELRWLSNFWPARVKFAGYTFPCVENAYQAGKCEHTDDIPRFLTIQPGQAKRLGRIVAQRHGFDNEKLDFMLNLLRQKFSHEDLKAKLLATGDTPIVEVNHWRDTFWGVTEEGVGQNKLGKLIGRVRNELRAQ